MTEFEEPADEALIRRLREAIGPERAANMSEEEQLEAVLRMLADHPVSPKHRRDSRDS